MAILPDEECSVNHGLASVRGAGLAQTLYAPDQETKARLHVPMVLGPQGHERTRWEDAVDLGARIVKAVLDRWGPDSVGMKFFDHGGGGGGFENNWAVGRLFFTGIGTRTASIHNRPAYNSEVHAAADAGLAPLTNAYLDARLADTIVIVGANPYETQTNYFLDHMAPNLQGATLRSKGAAFGAEPVERGRMIIVDPRRTMTVAAAEAAGGADRVMHLDIEPGTDIALLNAIARVILDQRWHDVDFLRRHCEWHTFESWQRSTLQVDRPAREFVARAAGLCGIAPARIHEAARWIAAPKDGGYRRRALLHYEKGLIWGLKNYENIAAMVGLGLLAGNVGKPGTGISRLGGHQEAYVRPPYPGGRPALNVDESVRRGEAKVFWVGGCNPVLTTLRAEAMERALEQRGAPGHRGARRHARCLRRRTGDRRRRGDEARRHVHPGPGHLPHRDRPPCAPRAARRPMGGDEPHVDQRRAAASALRAVHGSAGGGHTGLGHRREVRQDASAASTSMTATH